MALAPSSPRLPSPPPPAEIQISPNSPSGGAPASLHATQMEQSVLDANSKRRIHPGTKAAEMAAGPPLVPLIELDSAFQLQEHLAALHYDHTAAGTQAITREAALQLAQPPSGIDRTIWLYELCRFLISKCNQLIVGFLFDTPPCSAQTCPEMRASEWQFLCAVHEQPKSCCAIDYCCHTLDWAANVVSDQKLFPSRFAVLNDTHSKSAGVKNLVNVFRRLHRIFAHAWFQHRSVFWSVESQTGLYVFFKTVCDLYDLLPAENYKLPPEAEGLEGPPVEPEAEKPPPAILKAPSQQRPAGTEDDSLHPGGRTNTRRHIRSSPSTGSAVTTVIEADEEDTENVSNRMQSLHISGSHPTDQEPESAEVPVIVERSVMERAPKSDESSSPPVQSTPVEKETESADADETAVELEPTTKPEEKEDEDEDEEPNVVPITADESDPKPTDTTTEEPSSDDKPEEPETKPSTEENASSDPAESKEESPKKENKSEDVAGESGPVPDPE
ncbi:Mob1 family protein [Pochonia chlamydosporia 170]|uniref:Mob1 family protein n=1 Tax=Pochonia chlamydosporia 170 TaxID=1380566 RepID=A0A179FCQ7_METCM|nr:Mob1 family protein [Pochonia chlamydosporia 170]OAQ63272.1 Mob1 family protein [Pochonia chlamydosporia 170]